MPDGRDPLSPALEAIITRHAEKVRLVGRHCRLGPDEVDELFQDVRIRLWRALERGERIALDKPSYVRRTIMSAAVDLIRKRRSLREDRVHPTQPGSEAVFGTAAAPDRVLNDAELTRRIEAAIQALNDSRRPVVRMYLAGYHIEEIATRLGWTEPRARNRLYRGLTELRARLAGMGIGLEGER